MDGYETLKHTLNHKGKVIDTYTDTIKLPNGSVVDWDIIVHKGAAAIVPVDEDGRIIMVKQYRLGADQITLEIPAGCLNPGEDHKTCAGRELEEETGYRSEEIYPLIDIYTSIAICNEKIGIYYTENLIPSKQHLDEDEIVTVYRYTLEELIEMILDGRIQDSKTISALLAYRALKERKA